jgi:hypothetical protein
VRAKYLGDSYDLIKRFWGESLRSVAPLYAHPRFVPSDVRERYTAATLIPILNLFDLPQEPYGLLLDPNTGIPLPDKTVINATASHAPLLFIVQANKRLQPAYMICFDQGFDRCQKLNRAEPRERKRAFFERSRNWLGVLRIPRSLLVHGREAREPCCCSSAAGVSWDSAGSLRTGGQAGRLTSNCTRPNSRGRR